MPWYHVIWTDVAIEHLAQHGVTQSEFEEVVFYSRRAALRTSASTGLPMIQGYTVAQRYLTCIFEFIDDVSILPVTAYEGDKE